MDARDVYADVREGVEELLTYVASYERREIPGVFERLSDHFAALGVSKLMVTGDPSDFVFGLTQSGYARRFLLEGLRPDTGQLHLSLSRSDALFDVLAAGALPLAQDLATLATDRWVPNREYEEDFLYRRMLGKLVISGPTTGPDIDDMADRMESVQGGSSPRLQVSRALLRGEVESFLEGLEQLAGAYATRIDEKRSLAEVGDYLFWARSFVNVEALALIRVAEVQGMVIEGDVPLCPPEARVSLQEGPPINLVEEAARLRSSSRGKAE